MKFFNKLLLQWRFAIPIILIAVGIFLNVHAGMQLIMRHSAKPSPTPYPTISKPFNQLLKATPPTTVSTAADKTFSAQEIQRATAGKQKLGHFPYPEGEPNKMMVIGSYAQHEYQRYERLAPEAALALMKLIYTAREEGIWIIPVSGFRSVAAQEKLFKAQVQRRGSPEAAAKLSAPPGYSEHQTGYALDLADGHFPKQDITYNFAKTDAFRWLSIHAKEFSFELSFPENNPQGVSYEPWHWRFVGSPEAQSIFSHSKLVRVQ
jgi:D-alanyl-D-alanine carboxypeptidase